MKYSSSASSLAALLLIAGQQLASASPLRTSGLAPIYTPPNVFGGSEGEVGAAAAGADGHLIPDKYIVVLKESHAHHLDWHLSHLGANVLNKAGQLVDYVEEVAHHFSIGDFKGYAGRFSEASLEWIRSHPAVEYVERDSIVKAMDIENGAPWGLARISHRKSLSLGTLSKYEYAHNGGEGVDVYVIDTGINIEHVEFEGRAKWGKTMPQNDVDQDGNGHGTHCAGTIASARYGVAKDAHLIAVKVLGSSGSGSMSDVVGGVAWAANAATAKMQTEAARNGTHKGSVANMSLGGGKSPSLDLAVNRAVKAGLHFAVAAGNDNRDACSYSPAAAENAITVGASTIGDQRAYFSNFGKCVDIFAPGLNILSTWNTGPRSTNRISGTSMASPHIAGLTAYYLSLYGSGAFAPSKADYATAGVTMPGSAEEEAENSGLFNKGRQLVFNGIFGAKKEGGSNKPLDPKVLKAAMLRLSTKNILTGIPSDGTPNYLAFNNFTSAAKPSSSSAAHALPEVDAVEEDLEETLVHYQPIFDKGEAMVEDAKMSLEKIEELIEEVIAEDLAYLAKVADF